MKEIVANKDLISFCGLYCGVCPKYLKEKCPGCQGNEKASWCTTRTCNMEHNYASCADCKEFTEVNDCKKFNNIISRIVGFVLRSDRRGGIQLIKDKGYDGFAQEMTEKKQMTVKRGGGKR
ncbi:MAG: DUF3795 domain-containing protein [bacterium]|nr:DUF3795 domain-containing protein [bacterium]